MPRSLVQSFSSGTKDQLTSRLSAYDRYWMSSHSLMSPAWNIPSNSFPAVGSCRDGGLSFSEGLTVRPCRHLALFHVSLIDVWYSLLLCMYIRSFHGVIMRGTALLRSLRDMGKGSGKNFYAVKAGRAPGQIFRTWSECEAQVRLVLNCSPEHITGPHEELGCEVTTIISFIM